MEKITQNNEDLQAELRLAKEALTDYYKLQEAVLQLKKKKHCSNLF